MDRRHRRGSIEIFGVLRVVVQPRRPLELLQRGPVVAELGRPDRHHLLHARQHAGADLLPRPVHPFPRRHRPRLHVRKLPARGPRDVGAEQPVVHEPAPGRVGRGRRAEHPDPRRGRGRHVRVARRDRLHAERRHVQLFPLRHHGPVAEPPGRGARVRDRRRKHASEQDLLRPQPKDRLDRLQGSKQRQRLRRVVGPQHGE
mmetsp:Transcript_2400/g.7380  ORF Transcript_2400/g.7380 Transcript_2400/m.7380 type:complete len:201 (+) Transcript_2400:616-1218(+)